MRSTKPEENSESSGIRILTGEARRCRRGGGGRQHPLPSHSFRSIIHNCRRCPTPFPVHRGEVGRRMLNAPMIQTAAYSPHDRPSVATTNPTQGATRRQFSVQTTTHNSFAFPQQNLHHGVAPLQNAVGSCWVQSTAPRLKHSSTM